MKTPNVLLLLIVCALWFVCIVVLAATFEMLYPFKEMEYKTDPIPVLNKPLHAGQTTRLDVHYCRHTARPIRVFGELREVEKRYVIQVGEKTRNLPVGCPNRIVSQIWEIPEDTPPGTYIYHFQLLDQRSILRTVHYEIQTEPFEVRK